MYPAYLPQDITSIRKLLIPVNLGYHWILLVGYNSLILILCIFKSAFVNVYRCLTLNGKLYTHMTLIWVTGLNSSQSPYTNVMARIGCVYIVH